MTDWETVIGLEVHCELRTRTKLFCGCRNQFGDEPNTNVCPVCLGLPGSLPVLNKEAVDYAMRIGMALHCEVRPSIFHRKNYFYPDMPKDYQVSQYDEPINVDGWLELPSGQRAGIERAHMEEDTGKSTHVGGGGRIHEATHSLVDYNRAGVPLVEIVGRPDLRSAEEARSYVDELRAILVATGASDGKMEEGSLRVDANVSVRPAGSQEFGTRCEIKNMNSLRSLGRAIDYEAARQIQLLEAGERIVQETRHWDENLGRTSSMRSKEEAFDYRYFPEPDLVPVAPDEEWQRAVRASLPVLPAERRARVADAVGVPPAAAATVVALGLDELVMTAIEQGANPRTALNRAENEVAANPEQAAGLDPAAFARLCVMEAAGQLTATQAKTVLAELLATGGDPAEIAKAKGFEAMGADALATAVDDVIAANAADWADYCAGNDKVSGKFVGQIMKATGGRADGKAVTALLRERRTAASASPS
ncbi:MAG: aspartyl-tRNA(Asn)/glutamyl-tRNA(Gln) amidotransferase subunit [Acidimicrobiaceae bacterium]|nr:aspartyl-tRNA(Asn)/glutamyl-tRNA(Gln) amidotransferase subunit [Acidimicrobiaceae bacterium]